MTTAPIPERTVYAVGDLTRRIKQVIETEIGWVWVEGELSNVSRAASGHLYFTIKDEQAQLRAAYFRGRQRGLSFEPKDGMQVRLFGQVTVYERSGQYQILVQDMEEAGQGNLQAAFEKLKRKLEAEGLFDPARKRKLPMLPRHIGIVTSPTGAAIQDMLNVLNRRFPNLHIVIAPVKVQGEGAAADIAEAIRLFNQWRGVEVLIVGRGGGSLEDLWAFNEEVVARAISESTLPVISAVGHEIDFSISDFVADLRAPTPSAAAELVIRPKQDFEESLGNAQRRLVRALTTFQLTLKNRYATCAASWVFREPRNVATRYRSQLDSIQRDLGQHLREAARQRQQRIDEAELQLRHAGTIQLQKIRNRLQHVQEQLRLLGPVSVLERGYSITRTAAGELVRDAAQVTEGTELHTRLAHGELVSVLTSCNTEEQ